MAVGPGRRVGHYEITALLGEGGMDYETLDGRIMAVGIQTGADGV
jgi:hypothetical protein